MIIGITDPQSNVEHKIQWDGKTAPTPNDIDSILTTIRAGQKEPPTFMENVGSDISDIPKGLAVGSGQAVSQVGKFGIDALLGSSVRDYLMPKARPATTPAGMATEAITAPSIKNDLQAQAVSEEPNYTPQNIGKTMYEHPINNLVTQSALMAIPTLEAAKTYKPGVPVTMNYLEKVTKPGYKPPPVESPVSAPIAEKGTVQVSHQLGANTPISSQNLVNLAKFPEVAEAATGNIASHAQEYGEQAINAVNKLPEVIKSVGGDLYKQSGIDFDKTKVPAMQPLVDTMNEIEKQLGTATSDARIKALNEVKKTTQRLIDKSDKDGNLSFGQTVESATEMYDNAKSAEKSGDTFIQNAYETLGDNLTRAKYQIPEIAKIAPQYKALMQAKDSLTKVFRLNSDRGKMTLDTKIANMYANAKNIARLQEMNNIFNELDKHSDVPEFREAQIAIAKTQLAADALHGKATEIPGLSKLPFVGRLAKISPEVAIERMGHLARNGKISLSGLESRIPESKIPMLKRYATTRSAYGRAVPSSIVGGNIPKVAPNIAMLNAVIAAGKSNKGAK